MNRTHPIATAILMALLVVPLAAPLCAAGLCDVSLTCQAPMQPTNADEGLRLEGPSCCLSMSAAIAEPELATRDALWSMGLVAPTPLARSSALAPPPSRPIVLAPMPARTGRVTLTLHRTLLL